MEIFNETNTKTNSSILRSNRTNTTQLGKSNRRTAKHTPGGKRLLFKTKGDRMTREEYDEWMNGVCSSDEEIAANRAYIESLERQNTSLQARIKQLEEVNKNYGNTILQLREKVKELEEPKMCDGCRHHGEQSDDGWGVCSNLGSWLYLEETPSHSMCQYYEPKQN